VAHRMHGKEQRDEDVQAQSDEWHRVLPLWIVVDVGAFIAAPNCSST
jgi:hypothetical protein